MSTHDDVAHNWAHQTGRGHRGFNMYYSGPVIFSYGQHFPVARIAAPGVVLFTTSEYSVSTSQHKFIVRRACSHMRVFGVADVLASTKADHRTNADDMWSRVEEKVVSAGRRRLAYFFEDDLREAGRLVDQYNAYCKHFRLGRPARTMPNVEKVRERARKLVARQARARRRETARQAARMAEWSAKVETEVVPAWRAGENVTVPYQFTGNRYLLRVAGDEVQTSGGARFPVSDAVRVWPKIVGLRSRLDELGPLDFKSHTCLRFGPFRVNRIDVTGIKAGCHFVTWDEAERLARTLGLTTDQEET